MATRNFDRAREYLSLDAGSEWSNNVAVAILVREGKKQEALAALKLLPDSPFFHTRAVEACYSFPRPPGAQELLEKTGAAIEAFHDPEPQFGIGSLFSSCLGNAFTGRVVKSAIQGGFCGYDYIQSDSALAEFRKSPEYADILAEAKQCKARFLAGRENASSSIHPAASADGTAAHNVEPHEDLAEESAPQVGQIVEP